MAKTLQDVLALIQDPEAKAVLDQTISTYTAEKARLDSLEAQLKTNELVDRSIASGWRKFDSEVKPKIETELATLRQKVATLEPEANAAAVLRKQIADDGRTVTDPKDLVPALRTEFISATDRAKIVEDAVKAATEKISAQVNMGSIPALAGMVEAKINAKQNFGLDLPINTIAEAVTRHGSVDAAYAALTADAARQKVEADRAADAARHKAEVEAARAEGIRMGRQEADTRAYNPEESGSSGVLPMVPPQDDKDLAGVDATTYNPADGVLAREAAKRLAQQESSTQRVQ